MFTSNAHMKALIADDIAKKPVWGILGGMGSLASAEFVRTIYGECVGQNEHENPIIVLLSDPTIPDRSESFLNGTEDFLFEHMLKRIDQLAQFGVTNIVVCCVTIHALIDRLPQELRRRVISLVDLVLQKVSMSESRHLLLCTEGTRHKQVFERHRLWQQVHERVVLLGAEDQHSLHDLIYQIKAGTKCRDQIDFVVKLVRKYQVSSYIAGCTEIHLLSKELRRQQPRAHNISAIDPLIDLATIIRNGAKDVM